MSTETFDPSGVVMALSVGAVVPPRTGAGPRDEAPVRGRGANRRRRSRRGRADTARRWSSTESTSVASTAALDAASTGEAVAVKFRAMTHAASRPCTGPCMNSTRAQSLAIDKRVVRVALEFELLALLRDRVARLAVRVGEHDRSDQHHAGDREGDDEQRYHCQTVGRDRINSAVEHEVHRGSDARSAGEHGGPLVARPTTIGREAGDEPRYEADDQRGHRDRDDELDRRE